MKIFLDSSFIISFVIKTDSNYKKASQLDEKENILSNECYVSNLIVNEIITVLGNKKGLEIAINTYRVLKDNCTIINEYDIPYFTESN